MFALKNFLVLSGLLALHGNQLIEGKVIIEKIDVEKFDSNVLKVTTNIRKENDDNVIDIDVDLLRDLSKSIFMQIHIQKDIDGKMKTLYKSDLIDRCHFLENQDKYPQVRMLVDDLKKYGNMMQGCPMKKGKYYVKGFKFEPKEDFIHLLSPGEYIMHYSLTESVGSALDELYSVKWIARIE